MDWISVNERLPVTADHVLVQNSSKDIGIAYYSRTLECDHWREIPTRMTILDISREWSTRNIQIRAVTHWMPLPEPPK